MPLPFVDVSFGAINQELGRASNTANTSLQSLCNGTYATINTNSTNKPDGSSPHSVSEFQGYDHSATGAPSPNTTKISDTPTGGPCEPSGSVETNIYSSTTFWETDQVVFTDDQLETPFDGGENWWQAEGDMYVRIDAQGVVLEFQQC